MMTRTQRQFLQMSYTLTGLLGSVAIFYFSQQYLHQAQQQLEQDLQQQKQLQQKVRALQLSRQQQMLSEPIFYALQSQGLFQAESRLDWLEQMQGLRKHANNVQYQIDAQQQYPHPIQSDTWQLNYSPMTVQFELLHEGQLLNFFERMARATSNWYQLEGCVLHRMGSTHEQANLSAECKGGWVTLSRKGNA